RLVADELGVLESPPHCRIALQRRVQELHGASAALLEVIGATDCANTHDAIRQRDHPHPALLEAVDADVARVLARAWLGAAKVAENRRALVLGATTPQPATSGKESVAAARVHEVAGLDAVTLARVGAHFDQGIPRAELL